MTEFHLLKPDSTSCAFLLGKKEFFFRNSAKNDINYFYDNESIRKAFVLSGFLYFEIF